MDGFRPSQEQIVDFLKTVDHGVVATITPDGWPWTALVGFSANDELEIMFGTDEISQKAINLFSDQRASFVVTDVHVRYQVQLIGYAFRLSHDEYLARRAAHYRKLPSSERFENEPGQVFYVIRPVRVLFRDCNPEHSRDWVVTTLELS